MTVQHRQLRKQVQALQASCHLHSPFSSTAVKHGPCLLSLKRRSRLSKPSAFGNFFASPTWNTRPTTGCGAISTSLWVHRNLFWQLSRDGNLHVTRNENLSKTIPQDTIEDGRLRGQQRKCRIDNIKEWTSLPIPELLTMAFCRKIWKRISAESSLMFPGRLTRSRD